MSTFLKYDPMSGFATAEGKKGLKVASHHKCTFKQMHNNKESVKDFTITMAVDPSANKPTDPNTKPTGTCVAKAGIPATRAAMCTVPATKT